MASEPETTAACPHCGARQISAAAQAYRSARWRMAVMQATPQEVWQQYRADGIDLHEALAMELSYAG